MTPEEELALLKAKLAGENKGNNDAVHDELASFLKDLEKKQDDKSTKDTNTPSKPAPVDTTPVVTPPPPPPVVTPPPPPPPVEPTPPPAQES